MIRRFDPSFLQRALLRSAFILATAVFASHARAQDEGSASIIRESDKIIIDEKGDATISAVLAFPTEAEYSHVKTTNPDPNLLLRSVLGSSGKLAVTDSTVRYDDARKAIVVDETTLGAAIVRNHHWQAFIGGKSDNPELIYTDYHKCYLMKVTNSDNLLLIDRIEVQLPSQCSYIRLNDDGWLEYDFDRAEKTGAPQLDADLTVKPRIMSAVYKAYGNSDFSDGAFWTAKAIFTNSGAGDIKDLKISYRIGDYSPWTTDSEHYYKLLAAGGHVVDLYYPIFDPKIAEITSPTPIDLEVKYDYTDAAGKTYEDSTSKRIVILGVNQIEWSNVPVEERSSFDTTAGWKDAMSNSPLSAGWVNYLDPPVRALNGLVHQSAGSLVASAGQDDEGTTNFCKTLFMLEQANGLQYQNSTSWYSSNGSGGQTLKYPRDTMRDKSGTCIELAILYAAVCESSGVKSYLMCVPGHCFPVVQLPSGDLLPVESTMVQGVNEKTQRPYTFEDVANVGYKELEKYGKSGLYYKVDVEDLQGYGVQCPDLPPLDNDVLTKWGWKTIEVTATDGDQGNAPETTPARTPAPVPVADISGTYVGTCKSTVNGDSIQIQFVLNQQGNSITGQASYPGIVNQGVIQGNVQGALLTYTAQISDQQGQFMVHFTGQASGPKIVGNYRSDRGQQGTFEVTRNQ